MFRENKIFDEFLQACGSLDTKTYMCCSQQHKIPITSIFSSQMLLDC